MANRLDLHEILCKILGSKNVYFQPPSDIIMHYPAIVYSLTLIDTKYANNKKYLNKRCYSVTIIDKCPDSEYVDKILNLDYCSFDRSYTANGLNHFVFKLYY